MNDLEIKLVITKQINASVEKAYQAWTEPEIIKQWFGPAPDMTVPNAEMDLQIGGEYLIHMHNLKDNSDHIVSGSYEKILPNEKIVFSWKWQNGTDRTQVTIDFHSKNKNETLLTLTHRGFREQEFVDNHNQGWTGCLAGLGTYFS